ncbi:hypothetical protein, partial [Heyndrickxia coagulans]
MKRGILGLLTAVLLIVLAFPSSSLAATPTSNRGATPQLSGNEPTYTYWIQSGDPKYIKKSFGGWRDVGAAVHGPTTLVQVYKESSSISVTASAGIPVKQIEAGLSSDFSKKYSLTTTTKTKIPKGKKGQFQVRSVYKYYKVTMVQWMAMDGKRKKQEKRRQLQLKRKHLLKTEYYLGLAERIKFGQIQAKFRLSKYKIVLCKNF